MKELNELYGPNLDRGKTIIYYPVLNGIRVARSVVFYIMYCRSDRCLSFCVWPLCGLYFFDLWLVISHLVFSMRIRGSFDRIRYFGSIYGPSIISPKDTHLDKTHYIGLRMQMFRFWNFRWSLFRKQKYVVILHCDISILSWKKIKPYCF